MPADKSLSGGTEVRLDEADNIVSMRVTAGHRLWDYFVSTYWENDYHKLFKHLKCHDTQYVLIKYFLLKPPATGLFIFYLQFLEKKHATDEERTHTKW